MSDERTHLRDALFHLSNAERALRVAEGKADGPTHRRRARNLLEQTGRLRRAAVRVHDLIAAERRRELLAARRVA